MSDMDRKNIEPQNDTTSSANAESVSSAAAAQQRLVERRENRRWWVKLVIQPMLFVGLLAALIVCLGVAQRIGWMTGGGSAKQSAQGGGASRYICPMMCTPPQNQPGRCPVCAMELVPATARAGDGDSQSIVVDGTARRIANIQTAAVTSMPMTRTIRAVGELSYDEGSLKTISAYVDGRLDRLYADYTGVVVNEGDHLALVYSPKLYSGQVELLLARKSRDQGQTATIQRVRRSTQELYESSKQRLIELGMTDEQIQKLEETGKANSRLHLCAPISGTVIDKLAVEGQYVKEGQPIYKLADLSTVWLMLELFPEDASAIRYGQKVRASVQSLPGEEFDGRIAFIAPSVNPKTRTVGVRIVIQNPKGLLRVGDYAKAEIALPMAATMEEREIYDAELANKWISPRHPHVIESSPGKCRLCGVELVPASQFGFAADAIDNGQSLVVPRDAILMAGKNSVVYVETKPGRFQIRRVVLGPNCGDQIVIMKGVKEGEHVATRGNFLIDSQMQLAGNPSLIDPTRVEPYSEGGMSPKMIAALEKLSKEDRGLAKSQSICPVTMMALGSMGTPKKVDVEGKSVFVCCEGCRGSLLEKPALYLAKLNSAKVGEDDAVNAGSDLPPIGAPIIAEPQDLPPIGAPLIVDPQHLPPIGVPEIQEDQGDASSNELQTPLGENGREIVR